MREHTISPFGLCFKSFGFKKFDCILGSKCIDCRIEKSSVYGNIIDKSLHIAVVGKVTPSFARYHNFPADTLVLFDYRN